MKIKFIEFKNEPISILRQKNPLDLKNDDM